MLACRLKSDADLGWALERVREGQTVQVTVPELAGVRRSRQQHAKRTQLLFEHARREAWVSDVSYRHFGVRGQKRQIIGFVLSPRRRGDATGVREPRQPDAPVLPDLAAEAELP